MSRHNGEMGGGWNSATKCHMGEGGGLKSAKKVSNIIWMASKVCFKWAIKGSFYYFILPKSTIVEHIKIFYNFLFNVGFMTVFIMSYVAAVKKIML